MNTFKDLYRKHRAQIRKMLLAKGGSTTEIKTPEDQIAFVCREYNIKKSDSIPSLDAYFTKAAGNRPAKRKRKPAPHTEEAAAAAGAHNMPDLPLNPNPSSEEPETTGADTAEPAAAATAIAGSIAGALGSQLESLLAGAMKPTIDKEEIIALIKEHSSGALNIEITGHIEKPAISIEGAHCKFPILFDILQLSKVSGQNLYMYGPAGSGKTTIAKQLAQALDLPFYSTGAVFDKFELLGFNDVNSKYCESELYKAYTQGGVFLFDELDGSAPEALVAFNQLLANEEYCFPNGMQQKHVDFYAVAAANTNGLGATGAYSSRAVIDGATLDRFTSVRIDYDLELENSITFAAALAVNPDIDNSLINDWLAEVRAVRSWLEENNSDVIVSPRASKGGAVLLAKGHDIETVRAVTIHAHLSDDQLSQIAAA